jgi:hypothetical protein
LRADETDKTAKRAVRGAFFVQHTQTQQEDKPPRHIHQAGGVCAVGEKMQDNAVKIYRFGNSEVTVCDDFYRDKPPCETEQILEEITRIAQNALSAASE